VKKPPSAAEVLGGAVALAGLVMLAAWAEASLFVLMWGWFVLPVLPGLPALTKAQAYGLCVFLSLFQRLPAPDKGGADEESPYAAWFASALMRGAVKFLSTWGIAAAVHYWWLT
jgi:hypothetical protein